MSALPNISLLVGGSATGRPLVLLHGIGSNARSFAGLMKELGDNRRLLAWDAPGYGASDPLELDWPTADAYADALAGQLEWHRLEEIDLLGHSWGAVIAGRFAARFPDRVCRLILASPALGYATEPGAQLSPAAASRLDGLMADGAERFAASRAPRLVYRRNDASLVGQVVKAMSEVRLPGYAHASRMLSSADLVADAALIKVPTLVLVGAQDEITPPVNCRRLHDALAAANPTLGHRFEQVADAGHAVVQEQPAATATQLTDFLPRLAEGEPSARRGGGGPSMRSMAPP